MSARKIVRLRLTLMTALLLVVSGLAFAQYEWGDLVKTAQPMIVDRGGGVGYGEVAEGFASFALDLDFSGPLTVEVLVTDVRPGSEYEDDDSRLWLFDDSGHLIAENDDSPFGGYASLITDFSIDDPGRYYAVVTTYPNSPEFDSSNRFVSLGDSGNSNILFELIVENATRDGPRYGDASIVYALDDFRDLATPVSYTGGTVVVHSSVGAGVTLFRLGLEEPLSVSTEVVVTNPIRGGGDSMVYLFDHEGSYVAEDDDGGVDNGSLISAIHLDQLGGYFIAVTSYPNYPVMDAWGYVAGFSELGEGEFEFDLVIGPPRTYGYEDEEDTPAISPYPDNGTLAYSIGEIAASAAIITVTNGIGVGSGEVGSGYAAFALDIAQPVYATIEVLVTDVRQGRSFADSDSVLSVFNAEGAWYASDDDGGVDGASMIDGVYLDRPGIYYAIVTTYPNEPRTQSGLFDYVETAGESSIGFDLFITTDSEAR